MHLMICGIIKTNNKTKQRWISNNKNKYNKKNKAVSNRQQKAVKKQLQYIIGIDKDK